MPADAQTGHWMGGVLNLDLAGSTEIKDRTRNPERWQNAHTAFVEWSDSICNQFAISDPPASWSGDGFVALFDDPGKLLRAIDGLLGDLDRLNRELGEFIDWDLGVRIGADWGRLPEAKGRALGKLTADPLNVAGHLQKDARTNQACISEALFLEAGRPDSYIGEGVSAKNGRRFRTLAARPRFEQSAIPFEECRPAWSLVSQRERRLVDHFRKGMVELSTGTRITVSNAEMARAIDHGYFAFAVDERDCPAIRDKALEQALRQLIPTLEDVHVLQPVGVNRSDPKAEKLIARWAGEYMANLLINHFPFGERLTVGVAAGRAIQQFCRALAYRSSLPPLEIRPLDLNADIGDLRHAAPMLTAWVAASHLEEGVDARVPPGIEAAKSLKRAAIESLLRELGVCVLGIGNHHRLREVPEDRFSPDFLAQVADDRVYGGDVLLYPIEKNGKPITTRSGCGGDDLICSLPLKTLSFLTRRARAVFALSTGLSVDFPDQLNRGQALQAALYGGYVNRLVICDDVAGACLDAVKRAIQRGIEPHDDRLRLDEQRAALTEMERPS